MTVDIRGTNSFNFGAQLMLHAVVQELSPTFDLSAPPQMSEYEVRARLGLRQTLVLNQIPWTSLRAGNLVPAAVTRPLGLARHKDVTGVVDASGFAYSDSFGRRRIRREAIYAEAWRARGVPVVRLPQAFGPFTDPQKREWARKVVANSDLVFARDRVSAGFLAELGTATEVLQCPDFTVPLAPTPWPSVSDAPFLAIVPNHKLITSGVATRAEYLSSLVDYVRAAARADLKPLLVIHDDNDTWIAQEIERVHEMQVEVFAHPDPLVLKAVLGQATFAVSSRFHAIVSALAGGVPTLALGWSHKYEELLRDFDSPHWITGVDQSAEAGLELLTAESRESASARLRTAKAEVVRQVDEMWVRVRAELNGSAS